MEIEDMELRNFCVTAYNDACGDLQKDGEGRLYPQSLLPFWDIDVAVRELERCHDQLGLTGFTMTSAPESYGLPTLNQKYWDPLWACAQERGLPVNFHIGGGGVAPLMWNDVDHAAWIVSASAQAFLGNISSVTNLICSGLLDRFPTLKFVSVESGIGWLPFLLELLEYQFDENGVTSLELRPREYFKRQIFASFWFEREASGDIRKLGEDNVMFETDFPHPTCLYPSIQEHVQATLSGLDERVQRKVLYETAARVYQLPLPQ
jgi:predicted TIM-barrel fold metal-dependent hydrolase